MKSTISKSLRRLAALNEEYYHNQLRSLLGNDWAILFYLIGGREAGKSYSVTEFFCNQWKQYHRPFYWLRLTEKSKQKLLQNNAEKLIDPDLRRKYNLDLSTNGGNVYEVTRRDKNGKIREKRCMARVLDLSTFYNDKGSGYFDSEFLNDPNMYYNICLDEMNREQSERRTFDIVYNFTNQIENLIRSTKKRVRIICIGNTLDEASDLLAAINFIPEEFGRYYVRKKRAVIDYIQPSEKYLDRRRGTVADLLMPTASTFTNKITVDSSLVSRQRRTSPLYIVQFTREKKFTVWDHGIVSSFSGEKKPVIAMRPFLDAEFNAEARNNIISLYDSRSYRYADLITYKRFTQELELLRPSK